MCDRKGKLEETEEEREGKKARKIGIKVKKGKVQVKGRKEGRKEVRNE